jgi:hypothetical protein
MFLGNLDFHHRLLKAFQKISIDRVASEKQFAPHARMYLDGFVTDQAEGPASNPLQSAPDSKQIFRPVA